MSWISNYLFGEYSDPSDVPDSYETAVADSYEKPTNSYDKPTDYTVDSYQQAGYSGYEYGGQQPGYTGYGYGGEQPDYGYGCEHPSVQRDYPEAGHGGEEEQPLDEVGEPFPIVVSFETDRTFSSHTEIVDWVQKTGIDNGYVIVIKRSKKRGGEFVKVFFQCSLGGDHKSVATVRKTGSKKIGCPFELIGVFESKRGVWRLNVRNPWHNHTPIESLEGHAYARRLSSNNKRLVKEMAEQDIPNRTIWRTLMKKNPDKKIITKDIHNAVQKINAEKRLGESPMQQLENVLMQRNYTYYTRENKNTNAVEDIFFVHPHSFTMWCAFPHVLLIDATYSTNMYNLPFVQVVGMTSTNQSFAVAHAVISSEKAENYLWVLGKIRSMLDGCMEPRVIITDRELALISACEQTFPKAHLYLCRFHIQQNVAKNSKKRFTDKEWKQFLRSFAILCESPTEDLYEYNLTNFEGHLRDTGHGRKCFLS